MRIGTHISARPNREGDRLTIERFTRLMQKAEDYGFDRIGTGDSQALNFECFTALTYIAARTTRAGVGPQVTNPVTRDVGVMANMLGTLDVISGGRAYCVLGRGDGAVNNAGLRPGTVEGTRLYFLAVRELLDRGITEYKGREVRLPWCAEHDHAIPLSIVAEGPRMLRTAGAIADGVYVGTGLTPEVIQDTRDLIAAGAHEAGRDPAGLDLWWGARSSVAPRREEALGRVREGLSSAGNHALRGGYEGKHIPPEIEPTLREYHERYDWAQKGRTNGRNPALMDELGLTPYFVERFGIVGTPDDVVARMRQLEGLGITQVNLTVRDEAELDLIGRHVIPALATRPTQTAIS